MLTLLFFRTLHFQPQQTQQILIKSKQPKVIYNNKRFNMAPNRNDLSSSLHSLKSLDLSEHFKTTSKYQLLVPPSVLIPPAAVLIPPATSVDSKPEETSKPIHTESSNEDYWNMPADEDIDYFSSAHLEKMMVQDADRRKDEEQKTISRGNQAESYWDWTENSVTEAVSNSAMIEYIMKGESIRQMLTCESITNQETQFHRSKKPVDETRPSHCNSSFESHSYFFFPPPQEEKHEVIERILKEEASRQVLLTETIVNNIMSQKTRYEEESKEEVPISRNSGVAVSYWDW